MKKTVAEYNIDAGLAAQGNQRLRWRDAIALKAQKKIKRPLGCQKWRKMKPCNEQNAAEK